MHGVPSVSSVSRGDGAVPTSFAKSAVYDAAAYSNETHRVSDAMLAL